MVAFPSPATSQAQAHRQLAGGEVVRLLFPLVLVGSGDWSCVGHALREVRADALATRRRHGRPICLLSAHVRGLLESAGIAAGDDSRPAPRAGVRTHST